MQLAIYTEISFFIRKNKVFSRGIVNVGTFNGKEIDAIIYLAAKAALLRKTNAYYACDK